MDFSYDDNGNLTNGGIVERYEYKVFGYDTFGQLQEAAKQHCEKRNGSLKLFGYEQ